MLCGLRSAGAASDCLTAVALDPPPDAIGSVHGDRRGRPPARFLNQTMNPTAIGQTLHCGLRQTPFCWTQPTFLSKKPSRLQRIPSMPGSQRTPAPPSSRNKSRRVPTCAGASYKCNQIVRTDNFKKPALFRFLFPCRHQHRIERNPIQIPKPVVKAS